MHWVLYLLTVLAGWFSADVAATLALRFLSWLPYSAMRRWAVILSACFVGVPLLVLLVTSLFLWLGEWGELAGSIVRCYQHIPTLTIWIASFCVPFVLGLMLIGVRGLWPKPDVAYLPRAATWSIAARSKRASLVFALLVGAVIIQDFELRWRLGHLASQATAISESMRPPALDEATNAAVHYQKVAALQKQLAAEDGDYWEQPTHNPTDKAALEYLERLRPLIEEFHLAAEREGCCFEDAYQPLHIIDGMDTNIGLISATGRISWSALLAIERDRSAEAFRSVQAIRRLQEHFQLDRRNVRLVFFLWCEAHIKNILEHLSATDHDVPEDVLRNLQAPPIPSEEAFEHAWRWHGAEVMKRIADIHRGVGYEELLLRRADGGAKKDWRTRIAIAMGAATNRLLFARDDIRATQNYCRLSDYDFEEQPWLDYEDGKLHPSGRYLVDLHDISVFPVWADRGNTRRKLSNTTIAAMLFRREHGEWPGTVEQLLPEQTKSDESFRSMRYRDGLLVYSSDLDEHIEKYENNDDWWRELDNGYSDFLLLGDAYKRNVAAEERTE